MTGHAQKCPKQMGTLSVLVVRSDTGAPIKGASAAVKGPTSGSGQTDAMGAIIFKDRTPGSYSANVTMPPEFSSYAITKEKPKASVSANGNEVLIFKAAPVGNLIVEVYDERGKLVTEEAELSASGPAGLSHKGKTGSHTFSSVAGGEYDVSAKVPLSLFEAPTVTKATVPGGGTGRVRIDVKRRLNVVTPKLELEYRVVLLDRKLSKHQEFSEKKIDADDVTCVRLSVHQSSGTPGYSGHGRFEVSPANVELYTDKECKHKLSGHKVANRDLVGGSYPLYLKAKTAGKFTAKLTLDPTDLPDNIEVKDPVQEEMAVVELKTKLHHYLKADLDIAVNPDVEPYTDYYQELEDKKLADHLKPMTDHQKVKEGRMLHAQSANSFSRAKLIIEKLDAAQWPAGTDDYAITLSQENKSGSVKFFDKDFDGVEQTGDALKVKVSALKAKEAEFWIEGEATTTKLRHVVVDVGLDRDAMAAPHTATHEPKRRADWARFTIVQVKEVKVDYKPESGKAAAWDENTNRFCINYKKGQPGRKVTIAATLSEPIKDVPLHFMLAEDALNMKQANWGVDLPGTWPWKDVKPEMKHSDKKDRKKLLHLEKATDSKGVAKKELVLSRFGGDKFHPAVYITQDAHLAKFVAGHAKLGVRKPKSADNPIQVWRQFWVQIIRVDGAAFPGTAAAEGQYDRVKATFKRTDSDVVLSQATVGAMKPPAIYPKYMVYVNGGNVDAVVVSDTNKAQFFKSVKSEADKPVKIPIIVCDAQWDPGGSSGAISSGALAANFPLAVDMGTLVIDPPLQGGDLFVSGTWRARDPDGSGGWTNERSGSLAKGDVFVDPGRTGLQHVAVRVPAGVAPVAGTRISIRNLVVKGANGPYLGEYSSKTKRILSVYDQSSAADMADFPNTLVHEIGHSFNQVKHVQDEGVPNHPNQMDLGQGNHCRTATNKCVMYDSGPIAGSYSRFCDVCHPYLQLVDMTQLK